MKYLSRPLLALAAWLLAAAAQVQAQSPAAPASAPATPAPSSQPGQSSHVSEEQAMEWFNLLDTNHDGCISRQEARAVILIAPKLAKDFNDADTNHDGCITPDEIRALVNRRRAEREARRAAEARQKAAAQPSASEFAPAP